MNIKEFTGVNMLCDIGNGTMNLMFINDKKLDPRKCFTEKFGTHQCIPHNSAEYEPYARQCHAVG